MKIVAVAMTEVQDDFIDSEAACYDEWDSAVDRADSFMIERVGDFLEIPKEDTDGRRRRLEERKRVETQVWNGEGRLDMSYRLDGPPSLVVSVCVMEQEV